MAKRRSPQTKQTAEKTEEIQEKPEIKKIKKPEAKPRVIQKVTFTVWFGKKVAEKAVKSYQAREISVFFRKQGLKDKEEIEIFEKNFKRFLGI